MEVPRQPIIIKCGRTGGAIAIYDWDEPIYHYIRVGPFALHPAVIPGWTPRVTVTFVREGLALGHFPSLEVAAHAADYLMLWDVWGLPANEIIAWAREHHIADTLARAFDSRWLPEREDA